MTQQPELELTAVGRLPPAALDLIAALLIELDRKELIDDKHTKESGSAAADAAG